jgi:hypothetical protein
MTWTRRILVAFPIAGAAVLTVLLAIAQRLHLHSGHIVGYCFLFGAPWAWLLDRGWFGYVHNRSLQILLLYVIVLWFPALLYSGCIWLLVRALTLRSRRSLR